MNKYKVGDMVEIKKGDRAIIVDFENDEAIIFNLSKMHPGKIKVKDIQKTISEPNCKIVVEKVNKPEETSEEITIDEDPKVYSEEENREELLARIEHLETILDSYEDNIDDLEMFGDDIHDEIEKIFSKEKISKRKLANVVKKQIDFLQRLLEKIK